MSAPDLPPCTHPARPPSLSHSLLPAYVIVMDLYLLMVAVMTLLFVLVFILVSLEVESAE